MITRLRFPTPGGFAIVAACALAASGCSLVPPAPTPQTALPTAFTNATAGGTDRAEATAMIWWQRFANAELDALITAALAANHDLAAARLRIEQARASVVVARAALAPRIDAQASATRTRSDDQLRSGSQANVGVAWEVDLWGANRAAATAAEARAQAVGFDAEAVALALAGDVAANYFQSLALADRIALTERNLDAARDLLRLVQLRYENGAANALERAQQRTTLLNIEASLPSLRLAQAQVLHALSVLLARPPGGLALQATTLVGSRVPTILPGTPAALLLRRPDLRAAEAVLVAANADIGVARAALLPNLSLSASAAASGLITAGGASSAALGASLAQAVFNNGRLRTQVRQSRLAEQEQVERYRQTVLVALREVEDRLVAVGVADARAVTLDAAMREAQTAYALARLRYDSGADDLLNLLDAQRARLSAEDAVVQATLARQTAAIDLYRALGGGY